MKVSVAIATYNGGRFIRDQLESLSAQTERPHEVIVSDDASTDETLEIVNNFAKTAPFPIRIYRHETNIGYAGNFNSALGHCRGDIVFLSDQDDVWFTSKIERICRRFERKPDVWLIINDAELVDGALRQTGIRKLERLKSLGYSANTFVAGCFTAFRYEMLTWINPIPYNHGTFVHDAWIHELGNLLGVREFVPDVLQYYRRHGSNTSDWVGNRLDKITGADFARWKWAQDSRDYCLLRRRQLDELARRLRECSTRPSSLSDIQRRVDIALLRIDGEKRAVDRRLDVLRQSHLTRGLAAMAMLTAGDYRYFSSWKSMIKDVVTGIIR